MKNRRIISSVLIVATALLFVSCGNLSHSRPVGKLSFTLDEVTAGHIAQAIVASPRSSNGGSDNSLAITFKVVNAGNKVVKETSPKIIPLKAISEATVKNAILSNSTFTIDEIPLNTSLTVHASIMINDTEVVSGSSKAFELTSADTQAVSITLSLNQSALTKVLTYAGPLPLWNYWQDYSSGYDYGFNFYLTTINGFSDAVTSNDVYLEKRDFSDLIADCFDLNDRLWYITKEYINDKWQYNLRYVGWNMPVETFTGETPMTDLDCDVVTGDMWLRYTLSKETQVLTSNTVTASGSFDTNELFYLYQSNVLMGAVANNTYYYITEDGRSWENDYAITLHRAVADDITMTDTATLNLLSSGYFPDADRAGLTMYIQDIAALEEGVFVLFRQQGYRDDNADPKVPLPDSWYIDRGGLLWLDPVTLQKKDIAGVTPLTNTPVSGPLIINDGSYKNGGMYYDEAGSRQIMTDYTFWHGVATKNEQNFYAPVKFLAVKPKKLVIADNGVYMYCDSAKLTTKTASRVVTVDLETFSTPVYSDISANFGRSVSGSAFTASSFSAFSYASDFYANEYSNFDGFSGDLTLKAGDNINLETAQTGIIINMPILDELR